MERTRSQGKQVATEASYIPQLGAMPCAYVLAPSVRQDEEQALACQPLPVTPETLTSLS